jgi:hypothetical protein
MPTTRHTQWGCEIPVFDAHLTFLRYHYHHSENNIFIDSAEPKISKKKKNALLLLLFALINLSLSSSTSF